MLAFLKQIMEERQAILQLETIPAESTTSMNVSKTFLEVLQLLFEVKYMDDTGGLDKKRNKLEAIYKRIDLLYRDVINNVLTDTKFDDIVALSNAYYNMGLEYITSTDISDLTTAIKCFDKCFDSFDECMSVLHLYEYFDLSKIIMTWIGASNGLYFAKKKEKDSFKYLNRALLDYEVYMEDYSDPIHIPSLVGVKEEESNPRIILNTLHHTTLQELGRLYLKRCKDKYAFVMYMHNTLNIRLTDMTSNKTKFDEKCLDMAFTLFDLSRNFLANDYFPEAKSHIAIGDYVIYRFVEDLSEEKKASLYLNVRHNYALAVSAKSWGFYGVSLLRFWMEKFSQSKEKFSEIQDRKSKLEIKSEDSDLIFSDLLEKELEHIPIKITETCILNLADAKSVFMNTSRELEKAREYFTADTDIDSYIEITINIADTYKYLAGFEEQRDEQIKLHKRRVNKYLRF